MGAGGFTDTAADALGMVWRCPDFNIHAAGFLTSAAEGTLLRINCHAAQGYPIEEAVERTQGTYIFTKRPEGED